MQPPTDPSALTRAIEQLAEVQAELARIERLLIDASESSELTPAEYTAYIMHVKHNLVPPHHIPHDPMPSTQQIPLKQPKPNLLKPGKRLQQKYKHHCKICDGEWIGDEPAPPSCNYCRSTIWQTGETKWALRRKNQEIDDAMT